MIRLDMHLHLGDVYGSRKGRYFFVSPEELYEFIIKCKLTHAVIIYSDIKYFLKLKELTQVNQDNIKLYPFQWVTKYNTQLDPEAIGVKFHHVRGGIINYESREFKKYIKELPNNYKVLMHTQSTTCVNNAARPMIVAKHAIFNPHLKFIIGHAGVFGFKSYYPKDKSGRYYNDYYYMAVQMEHLVNEAIYVANKIPNIWLDISSLFSITHYKSHLILNTDKFGFGTDYPFNSPYKTVIKQETLLRKIKLDINIEKIHQDSISYLES